MEGSSTVYSYSIAPYDKSNPPASGYDAVGNIVSFSDSVMGTWNDTYDTLNRIASATAVAGSYSSAALNWTIDPFGNRTAQTVSGRERRRYRFDADLIHAALGLTSDP